MTCALLMTSKREDTIIRDECVDSLSDVQLEFLDCEENGGNKIRSDDSEIPKN